MPGTMRGVYTNLTEIRRKVFKEVSALAYEKAMYLRLGEAES